MPPPPKQDFHNLSEIYLLSLDTKDGINYTQFSAHHYYQQSLQGPTLVCVFLLLPQSLLCASWMSSKNASL